MSIVGGLKVILDTNSIINCIGYKSRYRNVFDAFLAGKYQIAISSEMLLEYEEIFEKFWNQEVCFNLLSVFARAPNVEFVHIYYQFGLMVNDPDDNKFIDAYIAFTADYIISNDKEILKMNSLDFPPIRILTIQEFSTLLLQKS